MGMSSPSSPFNDQRAHWFARAGQSGDERRKSLVSYCVAGVGAYFALLTSSEVGDLSEAGRYIVAFALVAFGVGVLSGVLAWHFAGRDFHARGQSGGNAPSPDHSKKNLSDRALVCSFVLGVVLTTVFLLLRLMPP